MRQLLSTQPATTQTVQEQTLFSDVTATGYRLRHTNGRKGTTNLNNTGNITSKSKATLNLSNVNS
jgi:hypothetical protein